MWTFPNLPNPDPELDEFLPGEVQLGSFTAIHPATQVPAVQVHTTVVPANQIQTSDGRPGDDDYEADDNRTDDDSEKEEKQTDNNYDDVTDDDYADDDFEDGGDHPNNDQHGPGYDADHDENDDGGLTRDTQHDGGQAHYGSQANYDEEDDDLAALAREVQRALVTNTESLPVNEVVRLLRLAKYAEGRGLPRPDYGPWIKDQVKMIPRDRFKKLSRSRFIDPLVGFNTKRSMTKRALQNWYCVPGLSHLWRSMSSGVRQRKNRTWRNFREVPTRLRQCQYPDEESNIHYIAPDQKERHT